MTSQTSFGSTENSTRNGTKELPPLDLVLPEPLRATNTEVAFSVAAYATMLQIYNGYILWAETYNDVAQLEPLADMRLELCSERLALKDETIQILSDDRDHAYGLFNGERDTKTKLEASNSIKTFLVSAGTGVIGIAVGLIIGIAITDN